MAFKVEDYSNERKEDLNRVALKALTKVGLVVESSAKTKARFKDGQMRGSIDHKVVVDGTESVVLVGSNVDHAPFNEFGTGEFAENSQGRKGGWSYQDEKGNWHHTYGMTPQPFLRPAFRENKNNIKRLIESTFRNEFGR